MATMKPSSRSRAVVGRHTFVPVEISVSRPLFANQANRILEVCSVGDTPIKILLSREDLAELQLLIQESLREAA
jgi:hypothetical protein